MHSLHFATEERALIQLNEVLCQVTLLKGTDLLHQLYCEHRYESVKQMIDAVHLWCRSPDMHKKIWSLNVVRYPRTLSLLPVPKWVMLEPSKNRTDVSLW